jgi:superfamily II RNA helicase
VASSGISKLTADERHTLEQEFTHLLRKFHNKELNDLQQTRDVKSLLNGGVCYHHAGLIPPLKEIIQELFSKGLIKILFVTETFAAGVNMPAKTVVFTGFSKYDGYAQDFRTLLPEEYGQMSGRAGRRGMDKIGTVIHMPFRKGNILSCLEARTMMCGKIQNITSMIKPSYGHVLSSILGGYDLIAGMSDSMLQMKNNQQAKACQASVDQLSAAIPAAEKALDDAKLADPEVWERFE